MYTFYGAILGADELQVLILFSKGPMLQTKKQQKAASSYQISVLLS